MVWVGGCEADGRTPYIYSLVFASFGDPRGVISSISYVVPSCSLTSKFHELVHLAVYTLSFSVSWFLFFSFFETRENNKGVTVPFDFR